MYLSHLNLLYPRDRTRQQPKESKLRIFENGIKMWLSNGLLVFNFFFRCFNIFFKQTICTLKNMLALGSC